MKQIINTIPIEQFLEKERIASKSNQKNLILDIKEAQNLANSLAILMTRLVGDLDTRIQEMQNQLISTSINMDGGGFK